MEVGKIQNKWPTTNMDLFSYQVHCVLVKLFFYRVLFF